MSYYKFTFNDGLMVSICLWPWNLTYRHAFYVIRYSEALKVLRSIRGDDFPIEEELERIKEACMEEENELRAREQSGSRSSLWLQILTTKCTRRALFLGCLLQGVQQLSGINTVM